MIKRKMYEVPKLEIFEFSQREDVITTSGEEAWKGHGAEWNGSWQDVWEDTWG